ncbi:DUF2637 domain-containing protein [Pseudonocardia sp. TMWB2A]|uniref:DUF2637 domain-containing protein n=1 Tax=Pseudonocardia sp. TMWB2A TaxID=687430 RepID=UPI00307F1F00
MKATLYGLITIVAGAAVVLSFTTLQQLAMLCRFPTWTAWLIPVVVDAGAAAGTLAWMARTGPARRFGRWLALALLALSVGGNALGHGLAAAGTVPHWGVAVGVGAVAPAVLFAMVHLAVLAGRAERPGLSASDGDTEVLAETPGPAAELDIRTEPVGPPVAPAVGAAEVVPAERVTELIEAGAGRRRIARELGLSEHEARLLIEAYRERVAA